MKENKETFDRLRASCPDEIRYNIVQWENWMLHKVHQIWVDGLISHQDLSYLINEICTY